MQHYAQDNDGYKYVLAVIDVFSKYGWMRALKNKTGLEVANALKDIFTKSAGRKRLVCCDTGKGFYNRHDNL
jgi:hypothetical protein